MHGGRSHEAGGGAPDAPWSSPTALFCSHHPSQRNTFTGPLAEASFDAVSTRAEEPLGPETSPASLAGDAGARGRPLEVVLAVVTPSVSGLRRCQRRPGCPGTAPPRPDRAGKR
jgi:hypothetical protein